MIHMDTEKKKKKKKRKKKKFKIKKFEKTSITKEASIIYSGRDETVSFEIEAKYHSESIETSCLHLWLKMNL